LTFSEGLPDYAKEVLVYQVRVVPRAQLEEVFREPVEEPSLIPAGGDEGAPLPPG